MKMRIALITETYASNMGYLENCLSKYLARLGAEVHIMTMDLLPYYQLNELRGVFEGFANRMDDHCFQKSINGCTIHVLPHKRQLGYMRMVGLVDRLRHIQPDIVQITSAIGWIPLDSALAKLSIKFKLFTGNHNTASTFPLACLKPRFWDMQMIRFFLTRTIHGRLVSTMTEKCYAVTVDCADIAVNFYGVQKKKVEVMHLGVDRDFFFPVSSDNDLAEREKVRKYLGVRPSDIVCIYTGKLTAVKNAVILAQAIARLRSKGLPFCGLFIGEGIQSNDIQSYANCTVLPFMPYWELAPYYRASDIGVWPTNESTSMLDAAACGIPLIVSDGIVYREHIDGNGLIYKMNDLDNLIATLLKLRDPLERERLGSYGAKKMAEKFGWDLVARRRLKDYVAAVRTSIGDSSSLHGYAK